MPEQDENKVQSEAPQNPEIVTTEEGSVQLESRAFRDAAQAASMCKALEATNETRNQKESLIREKYDGAPPFSESERVAAGEDWRSNFSTHFMSGIVDRVVPSLVRAVEAMRHLSNAQFRSVADESLTHKATRFRELVTQTIRRWTGWRPLLEALAQENGLMGYCCAAVLDPFDWHPQQFNTNEFFLPEGTGLHAISVQSACIRQELMPHELINLLDAQGLENAKSRGWLLDNVEKSIAGASYDTGQNDASNPRKMQDLIREGTSAGSSLSGVKEIRLWHALAVEATGAVSRYIINRDTQEPLYHHMAEYQSFEELLVLFTYEQGPSKRFYGSKGMGRRLYNPHVALDRGRNAAFDALYLSGLLILRTNMGARVRLEVQVKHPFVILDEGTEISEQRFEFNVEAYFALDQKISSLAEISTGAFIPNQLTSQGSSSKTATESTIDASREEAVKQNVLERWMSHVSNLVALMTRRLCDPQTNDREARELQRQLIEEEGLTPEQVRELATTPATQTVQDMAAQQQAGILAVAERYRGDPAVNQHELKRREISALTSPQVADALLLAEPDATLAAEQTRTQLMEFQVMIGGDEAPVSPRDNHLIHASVCAEKLGPLLMGIDEQQPFPQQLLGALAAAVKHMGEHLQAMEASGAAREAKPFRKVFDLANAALAKALQERQALEQQAQQEAMVAQLAEQQAAQQQAPEVPVPGIEPTPLPPEASEEPVMEQGGGQL